MLARTQSPYSQRSSCSCLKHAPYHGIPPCWRPRPHSRALAPLTCAATPDSGGGAGGGAPRDSIRDFIAREAPLRSLDGSFRERPLAPTLESPFLIAAALPPAGSDDADATGPAHAPLPPCPGAASLHRLSEAQVAAVLASGGQLMLLVAEAAGEDGGGPPLSAGTSAPRLAAPRGRRGGGGGSYAVAARVAGLLGGTARAVGATRVAVQGIDAAAGAAQAAALPDRWCYMVRASAVAEALDAASSGSSGSGGSGGSGGAQQGPPRDVANAAAQLRDGAAEAAGALAECRALAGRLAAAAAARGDGALEAAASEAEAEVAGVLDWALEGGGGAGSGAPAAAALTWQQAERLSWAPFAAAAAADLAGRRGGLATARLRTLEATDLGLRLEDGLEWAGRLRAALAAALALRR
jgi:hypothetical protein